MIDVSNIDVKDEAAIEVPKTADALVPATESKWYSWRKDGTALVNYLLDSEVHTYAFSVAANAIFRSFHLSCCCTRWPIRSSTRR